MILTVHHLEDDSHHKFFSDTSLLAAGLICWCLFHVWTSKVYASAYCTSVNQVYPLSVLLMPYHQIQTCKELFTILFYLPHAFPRFQEGFLQLLFFNSPKLSFQTVTAEGIE